jgi:hypothetical protein
VVLELSDNGALVGAVAIVEDEDITRVAVGGEGLDGGVAVGGGVRITDSGGAIHQDQQGACWDMTKFCMTKKVSLMI